MKLAQQNIDDLATKTNEINECSNHIPYTQLWPLIFYGILAPRNKG